MPIRLPAVTKEFLRAPVTPEVGDINPETDTPQVTVTEPNVPVADDADWDDAVWEAGGPPWWALLKVGAGALALSPGTYDIYVRVLVPESDEAPVRRVGTLVLS